MTSSKTVDVDLAPARPGCRAGQCLEFVLQFVGIVGESIEVASLHYQRARILIRIYAHAGILVGDRDVLLLNGNGKGYILLASLTGRDHNAGFGEGRESDHLHGEGVGAWRYRLEAVDAVIAGLRVQHGGSLGKGDGCSGYYGSTRI